MAQLESLDVLIAQKAAEFADQIRAAAIADKEEEIRIEAEKQLAFIQKEAGIVLEGRHEFTVAKGRIDSVYDRVIIEYKNPSSAGARIGPNANAPGAKKVVEQIKGPLLPFCEDKWGVHDPVEVNRHSATRFLWALLNLGQKGKPFSPEHLAGDFGATEGSVATAGIRALYEAISTTDNPKARTFFHQ